MSRLLIRLTVATLVLLGGLLHLDATRRDAALGLPASAHPLPARVLAHQLPGLAAPLPDAPHYKYSPSARIDALAPRLRVWHGVIPRTARILLPAVSPQSPPGPRPLIILFHGAGRDGLSQIEMWEPVARRHGLVLLAPESQGVTWDHSAPQPALILRLIDDLAARTPIDRDRIFLFGHSDGAAMAQTLLNRAQGPWRAAVLHGGGALSGRMQPVVAPKPLRIYVGAQDQTFPPALLQAKVALPMAALGHPTEMLTIPGHNHWFYAAGPKIADHAWGWMASLGPGPAGG